MPERIKYIKASDYPTEKMCHLLKVSRSNYYRKSSESLSKRRNYLIERIREVFDFHEGKYGSPRVYAELRKEGTVCSENQVAKIMRDMGLKAKPVKSFKKTSIPDPDAFYSLNLWNNKEVDRINQYWAGDITYLKIKNKWYYLSVVLDLCSRHVIGWQLSDKIDADLVCSSLEQALTKRGNKAGIIFHSDRGSQYTSNKFRKLLTRDIFIQSISGKGYCYDNAIVERFFRTFKLELGRKFDNYDIARKEIFNYIEIYYNRIRLHSSLGYLSPVQFEQSIQNLCVL